MLYNAIVEIATKAKPEAVADDLMDGLEEYHPAVGTSLLGRPEVTITLPAESLRQALATALAVVENAAGKPAQSVEVMPTDDFDRRNGLEPMPELVSVTESAAMLGVSRQRVLQLVESSTIPAFKVGSTMVLQRAAVEARARQNEKLKRIADEVVAELPDVLAGSGRHEGHTQKRTKKALRCSCGVVVGLK